MARLSNDSADAPRQPGRVALVENHLYKQKIELHKSFDVELPEIYIDAKQPEQVLLNLYFNAIAAMPHSGQLTVQTKVATPIDGSATGVIVVKDAGSGIDSGDPPKIFEPFLPPKSAPDWAWACRCANAS